MSYYYFILEMFVLFIKVQFNVYSITQYILIHCLNIRPQKFCPKDSCFLIILKSSGSFSGSFFSSNLTILLPDCGTFYSKTLNNQENQIFNAYIHIHISSPHSPFIFFPKGAFWDCIELHASLARTFFPLKMSNEERKHHIM